MMAYEQQRPQASAWTGMRRGDRARPLEWVVERGLWFVAIATIATVFLIFLFVGGTALPIFWQPGGMVPKFNVVALLIGTLKTTFFAMVVGIPLALGAAMYVSQFAPRRLREWLKPCIEMLACVPSVLIGFFAVFMMAWASKALFGFELPFNTFVAGVALSFAVIPVIFSIAEEALTGVPRKYAQAALALGASRWQTAWQVVLPAALPGVFAAVALGLGRAVGESAIVIGYAGLVSATSFDPTLTIADYLGAELGMAVFGGADSRNLLALAGLLLAVTFVTQFLGDLAVRRLKLRLEARL